MITAKEAKELVESIENDKNKAQIASIEVLLSGAIKKGERKLTTATTLSESVQSYLKELGYTVTKNKPYYDQRDGYSSPETFTITF